MIYFGDLFNHNPKRSDERELDDHREVRHRAELSVSKMKIFAALILVLLAVINFTPHEIWKDHIGQSLSLPRSKLLRSMISFASIFGLVLTIWPYIPRLHDLQCLALLCESDQKIDQAGQPSGLTASPSSTSSTARAAPNFASPTAAPPAPGGSMPPAPPHSAESVATVQTSPRQEIAILPPATPSKNQVPQREIGQGLSIAVIAPLTGSKYRQGESVKVAAEIYVSTFERGARLWLIDDGSSDARRSDIAGAAAKQHKFDAVIGFDGNSATKNIFDKIGIPFVPIVVGAAGDADPQLVSSLKAAARAYPDQFAVAAWNSMKMAFQQTK